MEIIMHITLFEKLCSPSSFPKEITDEQKLIQSIQRNLNFLLNTRQGSLQHLPDYGLPDLGEIYRGLPSSVDKFLAMLIKTVRKYEPRLSDVIAIKNKNFIDDSLINIKLFIRLLNTQEISLEGYFDVHGKFCFLEDTDDKHLF